MDSYVFGIVLAIWLFIAIANKNARLSQADKLTSIVTGESETIKKAKDAFEIFRVNFNETIERSLGRLIRYFQYWVEIQYENISGKDNAPWKLIGYLFQIILLLGFVYADAIVISNNLEAMGFPIELEYLAHYEIAIAFGSFFSVIAGALIANEIYGISEFSDWKEQLSFLRNMAGILSLFLIFSGSIVVVASGLATFTRITDLPTETVAQYEVFINGIITLLVPVNIMVASTLVVREGVKGILALMLVIMGTLTVVFFLLFYLLRGISALIPIVGDVVYRLTVVMISLIGYFLFTPIDTITAIFRSRS